MVYHSFECGLIVQHKTINWVRHPTRALQYIKLVLRGYFGKRICTLPYTSLHTTPHTHSALASSCYSLAWHWCCRTSPSWGSRCDPHDPASLGFQDFKRLNDISRRYFASARAYFKTLVPLQTRIVLVLTSVNY